MQDSEVLVARHCGIRVLALSLVTNMSVLEETMRGDAPELAETDQAGLEKVMEKGKANHEEVMDVGRNAAVEIKVRPFPKICSVADWCRNSSRRLSNWRLRGRPKRFGGILAGFGLASLVHSRSEHFNLNPFPHHPSSSSLSASCNAPSCHLFSQLESRHIST